MWDRVFHLEGRKDHIGSASTIINEDRGYKSATNRYVIGTAVVHFARGDEQYIRGL
jgi:hypothetical protein